MNLPNSQQTPLDKFLRVLLRAIKKKKKDGEEEKNPQVQEVEWACKIEFSFIPKLLPYTALVSHVSGQAACNVLMPCQKKHLGEEKFPVYHWTTPMFTAILTAVGQMAGGKILKLTNFAEVLPFVPLELRFRPCFQIPQRCVASGGQELSQGGWLHTWWSSSAYQVLIANRAKWKKSELGSPTHCSQALRIQRGKTSDSPKMTVVKRRSWAGMISLPSPSAVQTLCTTHVWRSL